jgi:beta-1,2-mannobiose phosphorylase / 1,2-beta-oligomannan phosphorylase
MRVLSFLLIFIFCSVLISCRLRSNIKPETGLDFAKEMVEFIPYEHNPVFSGTNTETWDKLIRERGFILFEDNKYKMWYTGYAGNDTHIKYLGYATSDDGISWSRFADNPIFSDKWTEDMFVTKHEDKYYMFAEGFKDVAHMLTSNDGIRWQEQGDLVILTTKGDTISGPYGTPAIWIENGKWYLFYERNDEAIWLATLIDKLTWKNVQDEPVLKKGPGAYDSGAVAANQIIKFKSNYYIYYHGSSDPDWSVSGSNSIWTSNVAMSCDLIHWTKYPKNPIVEGDHSSPVLVPYGDKFRLYTMHDKVWLYNAK